MRTFVTCLLLALSVTLSAQENLSGSRRNSVYKYAYKITPQEAATLYRRGIEKVEEKYLHTLVDSSLVDSSETPSLPPGNYLLVQAKENSLLYDLVTISDLDIKLVNNNRDLVIALHDRSGKLISDAKVYLGKKHIPYHQATQTFRLEKQKKKGDIYVYSNGIVHYFPLEEERQHRYYYGKHNFLYKVAHQSPIKYVVQPFRKLKNKGNSYHRYFYNTSAYEKNYRGFMVFNKPMYKPNDTLRLKSYIMNKKGKGVNRKLLLRLSNQGLDIDTIIAVVPPYHSGGYEYSFPLSDSLDIDLDEDYMLTLEEESSRKYNLDEYTGNLDDNEYALKRKILMRGKFRFEEYELKSTSFTARSDKKEHNRGEVVSVFASATDENGLPVLDGRLKITVTVPEYTTKSFQGAHVFLPDTLWQQEQSLETVGETKIILPDSIFPSASFDYQVRCSFLNTNNENREQTLYQHFNSNNRKVQFETQQDSLAVSYVINGQCQSGTATLYAFNKEYDTLQVQQINMPVKIRLLPYADSYKAVMDSVIGWFDLSRASASVSASSVRTRDSILVQLINPARLPVWYTIFAGQKPIYRGYGNSLLFVDKVRTRKNYFVSLQYIYGGKLRNEDYTIPYRDKLLNIQVQQPQFIYPGQKAKITVSVSDADGKPVSDADLTAYAYTRKFASAARYNYMPSIPYFGKYYPARKRYGSFTINVDESFSYAGSLNWIRWSKEMGLDSIEYFKFLHPQMLYINYQPAKDSITQIAPFVVKNGELQPVHLIYLDEKPVFFSQSQQLQRYSFSLLEGKHSLKLRTANQLIILDSLIMKKGMKAFLSINADTSNKMVRLQKMPDTLTNYEKFQWSKYLLVMENTFGEHMATVRQPGQVLLLNYNNKYRGFNTTPVLVGPLNGNYAQLKVKNGFEQDFETEPGYRFNISKGLIKQKQLYNPYPFSSSLSYSWVNRDFNDFVLTENEVDSLWQDYLDYRCANEDLFTNSVLNSKGNGKLVISMNKDKQDDPVFVKNIFLFRYDDPDFVRVYKGSTRDLGYVQPGKYRLFLLLKGDDYFIVDSMKVQKNGTNYFESGIIVPVKKDSFSTRISGIINNREKLWRTYINEDLKDIKETFNNRYLDASTFSRSIYGQVKDKSGSPIAGVSILIKGTQKGTVTDASGNFQLQVPERGTLVIASVGYRSIEKKINDQESYDLVLSIYDNHLDEVVVIGYGTQRKSALTGAVASIDQGLQGTVAGVSLSPGGNASIRIRGAAATASSGSPLIIIDGVPYSGSLSDLDPALIASTNVLSSASATAIYGSSAADGAVLITTKKSKETAAITPLDIIASASTLRTNFRDDAFWQPKLRTDKEGKASFSVTFPDDITNWQTHVAAVASGKRTGYASGSIRSFKTLSANLGLPQFAVEGDTINVIAKTLNYMPDSAIVRRTFSYNGALVKEGRISLRNSWIDTFTIKATKDDSLAFKYTVQKEEGYFDGEERKLPVFKQGVLETKGFFATLEKDTSFTITPDTSLGLVKLYAEASLLPVLETEIESIRNYEYLCNEQLASKLKALLLQKRLCAYLSKEFDGEKNIKEILSKLNQNRFQNLWGWWSSNEPMPWISLHVVEAMMMAEQAGYKINLNKQVITDYLVYNLESYYRSNKLFALKILKQLDAKVDYSRYLDSLQIRLWAPVSKRRTGQYRNLYDDIYIQSSNLYEQLQWMELKQKTGAKIELDTLVSKARRTMFGNLYWGEENRLFFDNSVQVTLQMYRLMKTAGGYENELKKVRNYFLEKRGSGTWRNTYESSLILETILPDLLTQDKAKEPASLTVTGFETTTVQTFPYTAELNNRQVITVSKKGNMPVYFTAYQQQWNPAPQKLSGDFTVNSYFEKNDQKLSSLKAGEKVTLTVDVDVKGDADYVMIEIPIPAGCSYADKSQSYWNNEVHREYFKNKVSIFCSTLKKGSYKFTVSLMPRYTGVYHLNPAKAELMYFPTFFGREGMKKVGIN